jgi:hypothetical protein
VLFWFPICFLARDVPFDGPSFLVARLLPGINLGDQQIKTGNAPIQALATENANLDLRHVQPARVFWGLVERHAAQQFDGGAAARHIVKALSEVRVQVIANQMNSSRLGVCARD